MAYETGRRIVEMAYEDLRPSNDPHRAGFLNAIRGDRRDRRLDQCPAASRRHGAARGRRDHSGGLDGVRARHPAPGEHAARRASIWASASTAPAACPPCSANCCRPVKHRRSRAAPSRATRSRRTSRAARRATARSSRPTTRRCKRTRRLPGAEGQPLRLRDHEDERHLGGLPQPISCEGDGVFEGRAVVFDGSDDYHAASTILRWASTRTASW